MTQTHSLTPRLAFFGHISVVRGSIQTFFTVLPPWILIRKPLLMVAWVKMPDIGEGFWYLIGFNELSFCGPCLSYWLAERLFLKQSNIHNIWDKELLSYKWTNQVQDIFMPILNLYMCMCTCECVCMCECIWVWPKILNR